MGKIFNVAGPCNPPKHYMLSATERLPDVMRLIEDEAYFVVYAQRQCGKTTALRTLAKEKIIRERGTHLDSLLERMQEPRVRRIVEPVLLGEGRTFSRNDDDYRYVIDLGVLFRGGKYAVEVKLKYNYEKNREKAYEQVCRYMDHLGVPEGWLVVFDPDLAGDWDAKLSHEDVERNGKAVHVFRC